MALSNSQRLVRHEQSLLPSLYEIVALYVLSTLMLLALNVAAIIQIVNNASYVDLSSRIGIALEEAATRLDATFGRTVLSFIFWAVIGVLAYVISWLLTFFIVSYKNDVSPLTSLLLPNGAPRRKVAHAIILRISLRALATVAFIAWLVLFIAGTLPITSKLILINVTSFTPTSVSAFILSVTMVAVSLFVLMTLLRCILLRRRIFG